LELNPAMKTLTLLYHDIVDGDVDASGFPGVGPARYKLEVHEFERHLEAIAAERPDGPITLGRVNPTLAGTPPLLLTFDDGGSSAVAAADRLDRHGWVAYFLITTQPIGTRGFVGPGDIRELRRRGHIVGSHSFSHPDPMSGCGDEALATEWRKSIRTLEDVLGEPVDVASVPGGAYSDRVARAAANAGIRTLFTSEPIVRSRRVDGCLVIGRFSLLRGMPARIAGGLARGDVGPRLAQYLGWNARKAAKAVAGRHYVSLRRALLSRKRGAK
jgi:peptidoglycan/xylan/chitin deacetylase (PgdA/CDA1 family)